MADQIMDTGAGAPISAQATDQKSEPTVQQQIETAIKTATDNFKKEIAGLNRRNSELEKVIQDKELEHLKEDERVKREAEIAKQERDKAKADAEKYQSDLIKTKSLTDMGLPLEFAKHISGATEDEIVETVKEFSALVKKAAEEAYQKTIKEKLGGQPPAGGSSPAAPTLQSALDDARQKGDMARVTALQRHAAREGITLK